MAGRLTLERVGALEEEPRHGDKLPCARITSIRFKGTFSVAPVGATPLANATQKIE